MDWESRTGIYTLRVQNRWLVGSCCIAQGAQLMVCDEVLSS